MRINILRKIYILRPSFEASPAPRSKFAGRLWSYQFLWLKSGQRAPGRFQLEQGCSPGSSFLFLRYTGCFVDLFKCSWPWLLLFGLQKSGSALAFCDTSDQSLKPRKVIYSSDRLVCWSHVHCFCKPSCSPSSRFAFQDLLIPANNMPILSWKKNEFCFHLDIVTWSVQVCKANDLDVCTELGSTKFRITDQAANCPLLNPLIQELSFGERLCTKPFLPLLPEGCRSNPRSEHTFWHWKLK